MGIKGLMKLISDECPNAVKEHKMEHYNGRIIAIDASMAIYQFLIAIRRGGDGAAATMLTNEAGEVTSHIQGMFNRTIRMLSSGVKPVFVFDGKPPTLKGGELAKRRQKREEAEAALKTAKDEENIEEQERHMKRLVRASKKDSEDCKKLLRLMGVPYVEAPCEAEAQCAVLAKGDKVHAVATEDMDALTFETPRLLRNVTMAGDNPIKEIDYKKVVEGLGLTREQFIDLCILCGCDYCGSIRGIGPKSALALIKKHGSIEKVLDAIKKSKYEIPPEWLPKRRVRKQKEGDLKPSAAPTAAMEDGDKKEAAPAEEEGEGMETTGVRTVEGGEAGGEEDVVVEEAEVSVAAQDEAEPEEEVVVDIEGGSASAQPSPSSNQAAKPQPQAKEEEEEEGGEWEEVEQTPAYVLARALFVSPEVQEAAAFQFKWTEPNEAELEDFLINQLGFNPDRVKSGIAKLKASRGAMQQKRLDSFFKSAGVSSSSAGVKRKEPETKGKGKGPAKKGGKRK